MTNADFAQTDELFLRGCELANVEPSKRQASKFRREEGLAYKALRFYRNNFAPGKDLSGLTEPEVHERLEFAGLRRK